MKNKTMDPASMVTDDTEARDTDELDDHNDEAAGDNQPALAKIVENTLHTLHNGAMVELMVQVDTGKEKPTIGFAYFTDYAAAGRLAEEVNGNGNLFVNLNEFKPWPELEQNEKINEESFYLADSVSGLRAVKGDDIVKYRYLFIDVDPIRSDDGSTILKHVSATEAERSAAKALAEKIRNYLTDQFAFPEPLVCCSGNGWHLLYRINIGGTKENQTLIKDVLNVLGSLFNTPEAGAEIDTSVYPRSHLTKLYGTLAVKGADSPTRPHTYSYIVSVPGKKGTVTLEKLKRLAATQKGTGKKKTAGSTEDDEADSQRKWVKEFLKDAEYYMNADNDQPIVTLKNTDLSKPDTYCVLSEEFKARLIGEYQTLAQDITLPVNFSTVINNIARIATYHGKHGKVYKRLAQIDNQHLVYDLNNGAGDVVDVTPQDIRICKKSDPQYAAIHFYTHTKMEAQVLPDLTATQSLQELLNPFLPFDETDKKLAVIWLLCAMFENSDKCILLLVGPEGSGKSRVSRLLQSLIDPQTNRPGPMPDGEQNLCLSLGRRYCTVYDNLTCIDQKVSNILCQATQGGSYETRTLYSNLGLTCVSFRATLILNGILPSMISSPDLKDRCLQLVARVSNEHRMTNADLDSLFTARRPAILGKIFQAIQQAMKIKDTEQTDFKTRMQDFVTWGFPLSKVLYGDGSVLIEAYKANKGDLIASSLTEDPTGVGRAVICYLQMIPPADYPVVRYSQVFYEEVMEIAKTELNINTQLRPWPQSASKFTDKLLTLERSLAAIGIRFSRNKTRQGMEITIYCDSSEFGNFPKITPQKPRVHVVRPGSTPGRRVSSTAENTDRLSNIKDIIE